MASGSDRIGIVLGEASSASTPLRPGATVVIVIGTTPGGTEQMQALRSGHPMQGAAVSAAASCDIRRGGPWRDVVQTDSRSCDQRVWVRIVSSWVHTARGTGVDPPTFSSVRYRSPRPPYWWFGVGRSGGAEEGRTTTGPCIEVGVAAELG